MTDRPLIVVGLGNPGEKYAGTRHNIGYDVVDELVEGACGHVGEGNRPGHGDGRPRRGCGRPSVEGGVSR